MSEPMTADFFTRRRDGNAYAQEAFKVRGRVQGRCINQALVPALARCLSIPLLELESTGPV